MTFLTRLKDWLHSISTFDRCIPNRNNFSSFSVCSNVILLTFIQTSTSYFCWTVLEIWSLFCCSSFSFLFFFLWLFLLAEACFIITCLQHGFYPVALHLYFLPGTNFIFLWILSVFMQNHTRCPFFLMYNTTCWT